MRIGLRTLARKAFVVLFISTLVLSAGGGDCGQPVKPQLSEIQHRGLDTAFPADRLEFGVGEELDCWVNLNLPAPNRSARELECDEQGVHCLVWSASGNALAYPLVGPQTRISIELLPTSEPVQVTVVLNPHLERGDIQSQLDLARSEPNPVENGTRISLRSELH